MKLTKAIFHRSYPGAVLCTLSPKPAIAHICRQGGRGEIKEWYIVSVDPIHMNNDGYAYISPQKWDTMSFHTISACLKWFGEHKINVNQGWYPATGKERWYELGSTQK